MTTPENPPTPQPSPDQPPYGQPPPPPPPPQSYPSAQQQYGSPPPPYGYGQMPAPPAYAQYAQPLGPPGRIRPTGMIILLFCVTLGIWGFIYYYQTFEEMKRHSGEGLGGVLGLVISLIFGIVSPYLLSNEVGNLYDRRGQQRPVSALTGLWFFPGILILVGPFIWFIQTNNALNEYWQSLGVTETTLV
jgi:hypothetical protein